MNQTTAKVQQITTNIVNLASSHIYQVSAKLVELAYKIKIMNTDPCQNLHRNLLAIKICDVISLESETCPELFNMSFDRFRVIPP